MYLEAIRKEFQGKSESKKGPNRFVLPFRVHQDVSFHYFGPSADGDKYQMTLMKLLDRSKIGTYSLVSKEFGFEQEPMLRNKVRSNVVSLLYGRSWVPFPIVSIAKFHRRISFGAFGVQHFYQASSKSD